MSQYWFGKIEVRNRLYIVRKHRLSIIKCYLGLMIRFFLTIGSAIKTRNMDDLRRAIGNCMGVVQSTALQHIRTDTACISCGYPSPVFYFTKQNVHGDFPVLRCPSCSSAFVWPRPKCNEIAEHYESEAYSKLTCEQAVQHDLRYHPNSLTDSRRIIDRCSKLANGNRFLDVGAGHGRYSKTAMEMGFRVSACEPNPNAREVFLRMNGFKPDKCMFEEEYAMANAEKFDVVLLNQVLEHITNPKQVVRNIHTVLHNNGIAAIGVPHFGSALSRIQGEKDMYISPPEHLNFFSKQGLISLFTRNNFKLEYLETVSKVNRGRIEDTIRMPLISNTVWRTLYGILAIFELFGMGMVINAYFKKTS